MLLARTLLSWPASNIGHRPYVEIDLTADADLARYRKHVSALLEREPILRAGTANELEPRVLTLTPEAKRVWIAVHDAIETDQRDGGEWASVRAWASKAPAQALRIAGVLTLIEDSDAGVIGAEAIERAAHLMQHYLREAVRIVGSAAERKGGVCGPGVYRARLGRTESNDTRRRAIDADRRRDER